MLSELLYASGKQRMVLTRNYKVVNTEFYWDKSFQENRQYNHFKLRYLTESLSRAGFQMGASMSTQGNQLISHVRLRIQKSKILKNLFLN